MSKEMRNLSVGLRLTNDKVKVGIATVKSVDPLIINYMGKDYTSMSAVAMAELKANGSNKKTVSGWDYYGVVNPNPQTREGRQASTPVDSIATLIRSPDELMAEIRAKMEAEIKAIQEASQNRLATLQAKEVELAARWEQLTQQRTVCETDLSRVRGAIASLTVPNKVETTQAPTTGKGKSK